MKITHYGHACVLVECVLEDRIARVLIDPGSYSHDFEGLRDIELILITHAHPDHLDVDRLRVLLDHNPNAQIVHSSGADDLLAGLSSTRRARPGESFTIDGVDITVTGGVHACIHPDLPASDNNGYLVAGSLFHPGDALEEPPFEIDTLLLPAGGPWMKISEGIEFLRAVAPRLAIPIHQAGLAPVHQKMHHQLLKNLAPSGTEVVVLEHATPHAL